jgi:hypothetical protein
MKKSSKSKRWVDLTVADLRRETAKFDDPNFTPAPQPMPPALAARAARVKAAIEAGKRAAGRPKVGLGALSIEQGLLAQADRYAKRHGITRAALVAKGLKSVLGSKS